jgi:hypothetical protein
MLHFCRETVLETTNWNTTNNKLAHNTLNLRNLKLTDIFVLSICKTNFPVL